MSFITAACLTFTLCCMDKVETNTSSIQTSEYVYSITCSTLSVSSIFSFSLLLFPPCKGKFENYLIYSGNIHKQHNKYFVRFIDNVFMILSGTEQQLSLFFLLLNSQLDSIKFSKSLDSINFLDVTPP